jgi:hypothetical protein
MQDLVEHVDTLASLIATAGGIIGLLIWRLLNRMEKKLEELCHHHHQCREKLPERFVNRPEFENWKKSRGELWKRINRHRHDDNGAVVITEG